MLMSRNLSSFIFGFAGDSISAGGRSFPALKNKRNVGLEAIGDDEVLLFSAIRICGCVMAASSCRAAEKLPLVPFAISVNLEQFPLATRSWYDEHVCVEMPFDILAEEEGRITKKYMPG